MAKYNFEYKLEKPINDYYLTITKEDPKFHKDSRLYRTSNGWLFSKYESLEVNMKHKEFFLKSNGPHNTVRLGPLLSLDIQELKDALKEFQEKYCKMTENKGHQHPLTDMFVFKTALN
jgi:hypothetical protein